MTTNDQLYAAFATALQIDAAVITDAMAYNQQPEWDSVAHMALVAELESVFDVMLDTDDILAMSSVAAARTILAKYGVVF
ncbi:acyl carrier protein [Duganella sp. FT50W]|uniref:Acyl carrier protein n=1 Tax=Duganella lactea TaxID=2692173 RepID=A0A6L8MT92_9BURK|nr:acyl carrier protein [Duganella lactea]MYM85224.1 acyl carrier protein [Duganella lactea]